MRYYSKLFTSLLIEVTKKLPSINLPAEPSPDGEVEAPVTEPFGSFTRSFVLGTARGAEAWGRQKVQTEALENALVEARVALDSLELRALRERRVASGEEAPRGGPPAMFFLTRS